MEETGTSIQTDLFRYVYRYGPSHDMTSFTAPRLNLARIPQGEDYRDTRSATFSSERKLLTVHEVDKINIIDSNRRSTQPLLPVLVLG